MKHLLQDMKTHHAVSSGIIQSFNVLNKPLKKAISDAKGYKLIQAHNLHTKEQKNGKVDLDESSTGRHKTVGLVLYRLSESTTKSGMEP
ncbi:Hypothetical predicted protein [Octopus vulgaris]|uniref:Uncharacterized protein n=1 Tax=Octopus vulgaris TaxID=6645 RepID=A0AA36BDV4_OCTVU|nr:Hypothetical predicted protein [Octopus vulgaris]